jgi:hypothetical protein
MALTSARMGVLRLRAGRLAAVVVLLGRELPVPADLVLALLRLRPAAFIMVDSRSRPAAVVGLRAVRETDQPAAVVAVHRVRAAAALTITQVRPAAVVAVRRRAAAVIGVRFQ